MFPGSLEKPNGYLPEDMDPQTALLMIETQAKDSVVSQRLGNDLIKDVLNCRYNPNPNGPRDYFIASDDDMRLSQSIGTLPIPPTMIMEAAQQAFMDSGHQKDKI